MKRWMLLSLLLLAGCTRNDADPVPSEPSAVEHNTQNDGDSAAGTPANANTNADHTAVNSNPTTDKPDEQMEADPESLLKGQFAFADETGKRLLTVDGETPVVNKQNYVVAVGSGGTVLPVAFEKEQPGDEQDNGSQTMNNFAHLPGAVYQIKEGQAEPNATYFLSASKVWEQSDMEPIKLEARGELAKEDVVKVLESKMKRGVQYAAKIGEIGADRTLYLVQFERQGDDMLAALVLIQDGKLSAYLMPATYNETSTWRVDDGGEIHAEQFSVMAAAKTAKGLLLGITWAGAEGENAFFLLEEGDQLKETGDRAGRYMLF